MEYHKFPINLSKCEFAFSKTKPLELYIPTTKILYSRSSKIIFKLDRKNIEILERTINIQQQKNPQKKLIRYIIYFKVLFFFSLV